MGEPVDLVDQLRLAIGVETDLALAAELGVERSTVAQWRRRRSVPERYHAILSPETPTDVANGRLASRRLLYGDSSGVWFARAALALIPMQLLDFRALSAANLGFHRENLLIMLVPLLRAVCTEVLGSAEMKGESDFLKVMSALTSDENQRRVELALSQPSL